MIVMSVQLSSVFFSSFSWLVWLVLRRHKELCSVSQMDKFAIQTHKMKKLGFSFLQSEKKIL